MPFSIDKEVISDENFPLIHAFKYFGIENYTKFTELITLNKNNLPLLE